MLQWLCVCCCYDSGIMCRRYCCYVMCCLHYSSITYYQYCAGYSCVIVITVVLCAINAAVAMLHAVIITVILCIIDIIVALYFHN